MFPTLSAKLVIFIVLKTKFHCSYVLVLFKNFSVVAAMLPITEKLNVILRSECVNTWEFRYSLRKELKAMMILPLHLLFWNHPPVFEYFPIFTINNNEFKVILIESVLINRNNPHLNKKKQPLTLERFDSRGSMFHYMIRRETDSPCCSWVVL